MAREKICGIYSITNLVNNMIYIGQSVDVQSRWNTHKNDLNKNKHDNSYLQRSWNKYGKDNFEFNILEKCDRSELDKKEKYYIGFFNSNDDILGYNLTSGGETYIVNKKSSRARGEKYSRRVLQFDLNGEFIKEHINAMRVAEELEKPDVGIYDCLNGNINHAYGYLWRFKEECEFIDGKYKIKLPEKCILQDVPVVQISKNGEYINRFNNCVDASLYISNNSSNKNIKSIESVIRACCKLYGNCKSASGFYWMFENEYLNNGFDINKYKKGSSSKSVIQYDINGNFMAKFRSAREASKITGIHWSLISQICTKVKKSTHNCIFKFENEI